MKLPHPIPYQGSKRNLASEILRFFPKDFDRLIEPFAGSSAISIASAYFSKAERFVLNDINLPLINLLDAIINAPEEIEKAYRQLWHAQLANDEEHYYVIRDKFNKSKKPEHLLFLLAKCVKAAVRYNANGEFNQSVDKRRLGRNPLMMRADILNVSRLLKGKTELFSNDYKKIFDIATRNDLLYLDPPYQGTGINGGFNYLGNIEFNEFVSSIHQLNKRDVPFILSYDGRTGDKVHGDPLPEYLNLIKVEINAGRSSQATLLSRKEYTFEAIYLSPALVQKIEPVILKQDFSQPELFIRNG